MHTANFLTQSKACLMEHNPGAKTEIANMVKNCYKKMADRKILHNISWTMLLSGYQIQSVKKIWPDIKKAMLWFSPILNRLFPGWSKARLPKACNNSKKVNALMGNYDTALRLIKKHGSLRSWLDESDNLLEGLVENFSYIGNNNVRSLLESLGFRNFHTNHQELARVLLRWQLLGQKHSANTVFDVISRQSREEGHEIIEGYAVVYLFSQSICRDNPRCSQCSVWNCPQKREMS
jgi:3-methyladenine DNA glycosylase Tag